MSAPLLLPVCEQLAVARPQLAVTMRRYLEQIAWVFCRTALVRRVSSWATPDAADIADITRRHVEDYKPSLAERPGKHKPRFTTATVTHRLGRLQMFLRQHRRVALGRDAGAGADVYQ